MTDTTNGSQCVRCESDLKKCKNRVDHEVCNRSVVAPTATDKSASPFCDCCRYDDSIPDLSVEGNLESWRLLEQAKRRLMYGLDSLGLPHGTIADGFVSGLSFDFKGDSIAPQSLWRTVGTQERVFTGHAGGKITINIRVADTVEREKLRIDLGEGHRTLIGHFRHEIGHYYRDVLVDGHATYKTEFVRLFGDYENPT